MTEEKSRIQLKQGKEIVNLGIARPANILMVLPEKVDANLLGLKLVSTALNQGMPSIFVTTETSVEELKLLGVRKGISLARFEEKNFLYWVDCYSLQAKRKVQPSPAIERIASSLDLSGLSIAISKAQKNFYSFRKCCQVLESISVSPLQMQNYFLKAEHRVFLDTLSTLLQFNGIKAIERFLTIQLKQIKKANGSGFFILHKDKCKEEDIKKIEALMDTVIML